MKPYILLMKVIQVMVIHLALATHTKASWVNGSLVALTTLTLRAHMYPWRLRKDTATQNLKACKLLSS